MNEATNGAARFHDHLDSCARCRSKPFDLCPVGQSMIADAVNSALDSEDQIDWLVEHEKHGAATASTTGDFETRGGITGRELVVQCPCGARLFTIEERGEPTIVEMFARLKALVIEPDEWFATHRPHAAGVGFVTKDVDSTYAAVLCPCGKMLVVNKGDVQP